MSEHKWACGDRAILARPDKEDIHAGLVAGDELEILSVGKEYAACRIDRSFGGHSCSAFSPVKCEPGHGWWLNLEQLDPVCEATP